MLSLSIENLCTQINKLELLIDAIVPTNLKYGDEQQKYFDNPMKHEIEFAQNLCVGYCPLEMIQFRLEKYLHVVSIICRGGFSLCIIHYVLIARKMKTLIKFVTFYMLM